MYILNNPNQNCFELQNIDANKKYKISFVIDGDFHMRFDMLDTNTKQHTGFLTGTIYSGEGSYSYRLEPKASGIMCINKTPNRKNNWNVIKNITIKEV